MKTDRFEYHNWSGAAGNNLPFKNVSEPKMGTLPALLVGCILAVAYLLLLP